MGAAVYCTLCIRFNSTGQVSDSIPRINNLAESCVFKKQSLPSFF